MKCWGIVSALLTMLGASIGLLWVDIHRLKEQNADLADGISLIQQQLVQQSLEQRTVLHKLDIAMDAFKTQQGRE